jgi:hypothetical protein
MLRCSWIAIHFVTRVLENTLFFNIIIHAVTVHTWRQGTLRTLAEKCFSILPVVCTWVLPALTHLGPWNITWGTSTVKVMRNSSSCSSGRNTWITMGISWNKSKLLYNWRTVSQSINMSWYRAPLWDLLPDVTSCRNVAVWNLQSCFCGVPYLTRGRIGNLQCNHSLGQVAQNPYPYYCLIWDSPTLEG